MKLKLDENLGYSCLEAFQRSGHDVATVVGQRMCSADDASLLRVCAQERRSLVTLDLDFANPLRFPPKGHAGVAVLRLRPNSAADDIANGVRVLIEALRREEISGRLWVVDRGRIREYRPETE